MYKIALTQRGLMAFAHDLCASILAWYLAFLLRFNFFIPPQYFHAIWQTACWILPLNAVIFMSFGLYRGIWRFASIPDLQRILSAVLLAVIVMVVLVFMFKPSGTVPRSVFILSPILLVLIMGGSRFAYRAWKEYQLYGFSSLRGQPVLVLGADDTAMSLLKDLSRSKEWRVVGMLDDDESLRGREILGVKVYGGLLQLPEFASLLGARHVIIAMPTATQQVRRNVMDLANQNGLTVLTVPSFEDLMSGKISVSKIRRVEVEDLLGRESVILDDDGLQGLLNRRIVMVTGAAGSIGSELCRQIMKYEPHLLICFDLSEYALYNLEQEFTSQGEKIEVAYIVGDVKNEQRVKTLLQRYKPSVVFHAAAYKHVPLMETHNVAEALSNNVLGTYTMARLCKEYGIDKFVLISTDKAVNPTNVMGASKRLAEMVCQGLQDKSGTRFVIVRFGNVLGSSGSVIPKFREQIAKGGPVTVTHPEITRYFMSIPEAAQLVMQAGLMGTGAEIFVLDMGEPVKIADLARDMIRLSGLQQDDIEIIFTGLRAGEKLYEELLADDELTLPTPYPKLRIAVARSADKVWVKALLKWIGAAAELDETTIKQELKMWVEEYNGDLSVTKPEVPLAPRSSTIH